MRLRLRPGRTWLRLARCIVDGFRRNPARTWRCLGSLNLFVRKTWRPFSFRIHGEVFLRDFIEESQNAGMKPFLMWGTLLGYVREDGLIAHDNDIDVGILAEDWPKRARLIEAMRRRGYSLDFERDYKLRFKRVDGELLHMDFVHMDVDVFLPWEGRMVCVLQQEDGGFHGAWFASDAFDRFRSLAILDTEVLIPDPPERMLEAVYGDWRTPVRSYSYMQIPNWLALPAGANRPRLPEVKL